MAASYTRATTDLQHEEAQSCTSSYASPHRICKRLRGQVPVDCILPQVSVRERHCPGDSKVLAQLPLFRAACGTSALCTSFVFSQEPPGHNMIGRAGFFSIHDPRSINTRPSCHHGDTNVSAILFLKPSPKKMAQLGG